VRWFQGSAVFRIRRENVTATIFGGNDWHMHGPRMETIPIAFSSAMASGPIQSEWIASNLDRVSWLTRALRMEGEQYGVYRENRKAEGLRVYFTGFTPFLPTLLIR
jgi:hypothetical protein